MPTIAIPTLRGSSQQVLYPFTRVVSCFTKVTPFNNAAEQRCVGRPPLYKFILPMSKLLATDKAAWLSFFSNPEVMGQYGTTATVTLQGTTYSSLALDSDLLTVVNKATLQYDQQVTFSQTKAANFSTYTPPVVGSTYPSLLFGGSVASKVAELPFTQIYQFRTQNMGTAYGPQFSYPWYGNGLTGFPTTYLRQWVLEYPLLTDADLGTLETYFLGKQGRYKTFTFVDPVDGGSNSNVRFATDELHIRYIAPNQNSTVVNLIQINS